MDQTTTAQPKRRRVYYISGFDPRGARFYHQLYKSEAALQEAVNGYRYEIGKRQKTGVHTSSWQILATATGPGTVDEPTSTSYTFLGWDDIVRDNWISNRALVLAKMLPYYAHYLTNGAVRKTLACTPRGFATMVAPVIFVLATLVGAVFTAFMLTGLLGMFTPSPLAAWGAGIVAVAVVGKLAVMLAEKNRMFWMMRIMLFVQYWGRNNSPKIEQRWQHFAETIHADNLQHPDDEVLIVGHSIGGLAALVVAERYLALQPQPAKPGPVKLVVLGNLTPLMGFLPQADWFRDKLRIVGQSGLPWFDYSAPADPLCYRLVDAFAVCGLPAATAAYQIRSARFDLMFSNDEFKRRSRDGFGIHFQYLMATHLPVDNDYFSLTAGPVCSSPLKVKARSA